MGRFCKIVVAVVLLALYRQVEGLCEEDPNDPTKLPFPNIFDLSVSHLGYQMSVEANVVDEQTSYFAEERYDIFNSRGKTEVLGGGKRRLIIYYKETDEYFSISEGLCNVSSLSSVKNPFDKLWMDREDDRVILGPSAMFRHAYLDSLKGDVDYMGKENLYGVRDMIADRWRQCPNSNTQVDFYFLDPKWNNHLNDKNLPIPLRVTLQTEKGGKISTIQFEFLKFIPFVENLDETFLIPTGFGCQRLAKDLKQPVDLSNKDLLIQGELLYTMLNHTNTPYSYATTFFVAYDQKSGHLAHFYNRWEKNTSSDPVPVQSSLIDVYGYKDKVLYTINQDYGNCSMTRTTTYVPKVYMPFGKELVLTSPEFLGSNEGFHYFGESEERNIPVSVFEKKVEGFSLGPGTKYPYAVITRYYTNDEVWYDSNTREQQVPIRVTVRVYSDGNIPRPSEVVTFNVADFSTELHSPEKVFDVSSCFMDSSMSKWFQITFPMEAYGILVSMEFPGKIKDKFLKTTRTLTGISSLRIPKVLVDFDKDQMYVSALLLERPPYFTTST
ncbi:uncharacterized protein LOC106473142 [Limulus polyphemus]|uniref:Uncharacterized protein LOC106473142 n=1 Tax=Limulus polyphemus TaxID=6850 RepID=A0ABM1BV59_LIMPO|nr:uncharacterized protein LOC106473142 [Limulus polyphemus]